MSLFATQAEAAVDSLQLIPRPVSVTYGTGTLRLPRTLRLSAGAPASLSDGLKKQSFTTTAAKGRMKGLITTRLDASVPGLEATASRSASRGSPSRPVMKRVSDRVRSPSCRSPSSTEEPYPTSPSPTQHAWPIVG